MNKRKAKKQIRILLLSFIMVFKSNDVLNNYYFQIQNIKLKCFWISGLYVQGVSFVHLISNVSSFCKNMQKENEKKIL